MEITEIPPVIEDFEVGDRIYLLNYKHDIIEYGTIIELFDSKARVLFDIGSSGLIHVSQFAPGGPVGKCFPLNQLEVGSVVSVFELGKRIYADVEEIVKNERVRIKYRSGSVIEKTFHDSEWEPLEFKMADFTLEG